MPGLMTIAVLFVASKLPPTPNPITMSPPVYACIVLCCFPLRPLQNTSRCRFLAISCCLWFVRFVWRPISAHVRPSQCFPGPPDDRTRLYWHRFSSNSTKSARYSVSSC